MCITQHKRPTCSRMPGRVHMLMSPIHFWQEAYSRAGSKQGLASKDLWVVVAERQRAYGHDLRDGTKPEVLGVTHPLHVLQGLRRMPIQASKIEVNSHAGTGASMPKQASEIAVNSHAGTGAPKPKQACEIAVTGHAGKGATMLHHVVKTKLARYVCIQQMLVARPSAQQHVNITTMTQRRDTQVAMTTHLDTTTP